MLLLPGRQGAGFQGDQIKASPLHRKASALHGICRQAEGPSSRSFPMTITLNTPGTNSEQRSSGVGGLQRVPSLADDPLGGTRWSGKTCATKTSGFQDSGDYCLSA